MTYEQPTPATYRALDLDDLAQIMADTVIAEKALLQTRIRVMQEANARGPGATAHVASHWPGTKERRARVLGEAGRSGMADLLERYPYVTTGVVDWCIKLDGVQGKPSRVWLRWCLMYGRSLRQLKERAGVAVPKPAPEARTLACPGCGQVLEV